MRVLLVRERPVVLAGERLARRDLRAQIARLEARGAAAAGGGGGGGPRLLSLGELEAVRDRLAQRTSDDEGHGPPVGTFGAWDRLERMFADPGGRRRERVSLAELGQPGCGVYSVRPRLGLIGMLAGWWQVTLSSGCP
jgi:hypothetical protein